MLRDNVRAKDPSNQVQETFKIMQRKKINNYSKLFLL